jgi:endonuclease/exonuclease/phosphatase family metal-dependent hydrolase
VHPKDRARGERIRRELGRIDADVWVLTETHPGFAPGSHYDPVAASTAAPDRRRGGRWGMIWARTGVSAEALPLDGEPERSAAARIERSNGRPLLIFGTVLPWRGDLRHAAARGGRAFERSLFLQARDWDTARARDPEAELCIAGDFNQEFAAAGPVGTRLGCTALVRELESRSLHCVTGGDGDPLRERGWRTSIDHVVLSGGLRSQTAPTIWPEAFPLPRTMSDHYGVCITVADA